jgi:Mg2+ and Co2+ transporter CorA
MEDVREHHQRPKLEKYPTHAFIVVMPELHWHYGYLFALGLMLTITVVGYRYFKSKDWL